MKNENKNHTATQKSLFEEMLVDIKKVPIIVCKQPKTIKMIPCNWSKEQIEKYKASHYDEKGKFIFEPAPDFTILQGQKNRE